MSKKRKSVECSNDERTTEDSDAILQQAENAKRGKLSSVCETTLLDLPIEILESILVKAVAMEVKGMKFAKSVWKEKADFVIGRLRTVSTQWSNILTTNFFRNELHRTLDGIAEETIHLEIMHQPPMMQCWIMHVTSLKDEIFIHCMTVDKYPEPTQFSFDIKVYDRNNMAEVKDVIALCKRGIRGQLLAACSLSNCLYLEHLDREFYESLILRITRDKEHEFKFERVITDLPFAIDSMSISVNGSIVILSKPYELDCRAVSVYDSNGFMQHQVVLSPEVYGLGYVTSVLQKPNGNLVLASADEEHELVLTEISTDGIVKRQCESSLSSGSHVTIADSLGRIVVIDPINGIQLLDSDLNISAFSLPQLKQEDSTVHSQLHDGGERNEVLDFRLVNNDSSVLSIYRFSNK